MVKSIPLQVRVKVFLKNQEGKYLLLRRSQIRYPNIKNFWDIPGGRIIPGANLLENIEREIFEETNFFLCGEPKLIAAQDIIHEKEKHIVRLTFLGELSIQHKQIATGKIFPGNPILNEEHSGFKWLTFDEMLRVKKLDEFTREVIEKYLVK